MNNSTFRLVKFCAVLAGGLFWMAAAKADTVAAFQLNGAFNSFDALTSTPSVTSLTYTKGPQLNVWGYLGSSYLEGFSRSSDPATALSAGHWLQFSFNTGNEAIAFDWFYMNNDYIVFADTFKMALAYNNGSGTFSETLAGILPADINSGIDISTLSMCLANSTVQFRVIFYDDTRFSPSSALFPINSTLGGVDNSAVVFTGAIPEPATFALLGLGLAAAGLHRRQRHV
jgi:hypothetical protein